MTKNGRALTAKGIKPICPFHQVFQATYLFGAFSPINGDKFLIELPFCNKDSFQQYLYHFYIYNSPIYMDVNLPKVNIHKYTRA